MKPVRIITGPNQQPSVGGMGGSIHSWERSEDPWHRDAFPDGFKDAAPHQGQRRQGWGGLDWCGNLIDFVLDGTMLKA